MVLHRLWVVVLLVVVAANSKNALRIFIGGGRTYSKFKNGVYGCDHDGFYEPFLCVCDACICDGHQMFYNISYLY